MSSKIPIQKIRDTVNLHGGTLQELADGYQVAYVEVVRIQCARGHVWTANAEMIANGAWCGNCRKGRRKYTIEKMRAIAEERRGRCLSQVYVNTDTKLLWQCHEGHQWYATPINIIKNRWCRICSQNRQRRTIKEMQDLAEARGGKCLSSVYHNRCTPLHWECAEKHRWSSPPRQIINGSWCPVCASKPQGERRRKPSPGPLG
jgi:hypothetical protein